MKSTTFTSAIIALLLSQLPYDAFAQSAPALAPQIRLTSRVIADPLGSLRPKALPGAVIEYELAVSNVARATTANNIFAITSPVPPQLMLIVGMPDAAPGTAFEFVNQSGGGRDGCSIETLASSADCVEFSDNGGRTFDYVPTPGIDGVDSRVTHLRFKVRTDGDLSPTDIGQFLLRYRMVME